MIDKFSVAYYNKRRNLSQTGDSPKKKGCVNHMENESKVMRNILIVLAVLAAVGVALWALIRTEKRLHRLLGIVKGHLPKNRKNREFRIELEDI